MLYWLLYPLAARYPLFNVFRYITFRTAMAAVTALAVALIARAADDPVPEALPDRAVDPAGRTQDAPGQGGRPRRWAGS